MRVKAFVSDNAPSETTTVMIVVPFWFKSGEIERAQFGAVHDFVIFELVTRVVFEDVTEIELVQFGDESTSLNE